MNESFYFPIFMIALMLVIGGMIGCPKYNVYVARTQGEAELARAKGTAEANKVLAESIKDHPELTQYYFVRGIAQTRGTIYVPTESNLPIPEATRKANQ